MKKWKIVLLVIILVVLIILSANDWFLLKLIWKSFAEWLSNFVRDGIKKAIESART